MSKSDIVECYRKLNSSNLHKEMRRNPLSGDVCSPVENHDLVPSSSDYPKGQEHSRVPECDGRPTVLVEPSPINRMVITSTGVQTVLSKVVHSSCRSICQFTLYLSPVLNQHAWDIDAVKINWLGLTGYARLSFTG